MNQLSLRGRLVVTTARAALVTVAILVVGLQLLQSHLTRTESLHVLRDRADAAAATVRDRRGKVTLLDSHDRSLDQNAWIFDTRGRMIDGDTPSTVLDPVVTAMSTATHSRSRVVRGTFRLFARPVHRSGGERIATIVVGVDLTPYESAERRGLFLSLGLGLLAVAAAAAAAALAARDSLNHGRVLARRADDWREHNLNGRFDMGRPTDELTELGDTLDRMLDRIAQAIQAERRLTDEVAHELRTPLAVIRSETQLALLGADADPDADRHPERAESLRAILDATTRMERSIGTMLSVARSAHAGEHTCRAAEVLDEVRQHTRTRDGVTLTAEAADDVVIAAPAQVVVAALAPIADNAVRHAGSAVRVTARAEGRRVVVSVADNGPGVEDAQREAIFRPGYTSTEDGAGLGLALARRLTHSVGGEVRECGEGHGLFVVDLPAG
ncbi:MAG: sensor histidine kinase [Nocardioidaceae bacterium]